MQDAWRPGEGQESSDSHHMIITSPQKNSDDFKPEIHGFPKGTRYNQIVSCLVFPQRIMQGSWVSICFDMFIDFLHQMMAVQWVFQSPTAQAAHPAYKEALVYEVRPAGEAREAPRCGVELEIFTYK